VQIVGTERPHALEVVCLQKIQHLQRGNPLPIRREFPDVVAAIVRRNGLNPFRAMLRKILQ